METERLVLRQFALNDVAAIHELFSNSETMRLVGMFPAFTDIQESEKRVKRWIEVSRHQAIVLKSTNELMGYIVVNRDSEEFREDTRELGFALVDRFRKKGYMKEVIQAVLKDLKNNDIKYVWACCFKENKASKNLIESLNFSFQKEGKYESLNDQTYDSLEYRIDLDDYFKEME